MRRGSVSIGDKPLTKRLEEFALLLERTGVDYLLRGEPAKAEPYFREALDVRREAATDNRRGAVLAVYLGR